MWLLSLSMNTSCFVPWWAWSQGLTNLFVFLPSPAREQLRVHLRRHKGMRKFECIDCGYKFTRQVNSLIGLQLTIICIVAQSACSLITRLFYEISGSLNCLFCKMRKGLKTPNLNECSSDLALHPYKIVASLKNNQLQILSSLLDIAKACCLHNPQCNVTANSSVSDAGVW